MQALIVRCGLITQNLAFLTSEVDTTFVRWWIVWCGHIKKSCRFYESGRHYIRQVATCRVVEYPGKRRFPLSPTPPYSRVY